MIYSICRKWLNLLVKLISEVFWLKGRQVIECYMEICFIKYSQGYCVKKQAFKIIFIFIGITMWRCDEIWISIWKFSRNKLLNYMDFCFAWRWFLPNFILLNKYVEIVLLVIHAVKINISLQKSSYSCCQSTFW